jgi:hypothetical protein
MYFSARIFDLLLLDVSLSDGSSLRSQGLADVLCESHFGWTLAHFATLTAVMVLTRKVNWYELGK